MSKAERKAVSPSGYVPQPWPFLMPCSKNISRKKTHFAELQTLCSSSKAHGTRCNPQRDLPACRLQRLFFPPQHFLLAWGVVFSQAATLRNIGDELFLMWEPQLSGVGWREQNERSQKERHSKIFYLNRHSHWRIETQWILKSSSHSVGEILPDTQFWIIRVQTS